MLYRFGPYEVDTARNELRKLGVRRRLERKPWQLLVTLLEHAGSVVSRADLHRSLWGKDVFVDFDKNLTVAVTKLRAILNDSADTPRYIETVAGEGYRFVSKVERIVEIVGTEPHGQNARNTNTPVEIPATTMYLKKFNSRIALPVAIVMVGGALALFLTRIMLERRSSQLEPARSEKAKLVVLPFENLSGDTSQEYLADGITEELSEKLGNLDPEQLSVIGRTSAMAYKGSKRTITDIGKDLSVGYVLEGSVRRQGKQLRISAQLVKVSDQAHLWAEDYDGDIQALFEVEDKVASEIARQVSASLALAVHQNRLRAHIPRSRAHDDYLIARYYSYKRTPQGCRKSQEYFHRATQEDPQYAAAYAGLAECADMPEALRAAKKAVELDASSGEAYSALGWVELFREWDFNAATEALTTAIRLDPNYALSHHIYSGVLEISGHIQEAIEQEKQAVQLDPLAFIFRASLAEEFSAAGNTDAAVATINEVLKIDPQYPKAHETLGSIDVRIGKYREGIREFELSERYGGGKIPELFGYAYARMGDKHQASKVLSEMQKSPDYVPGFGTALVELGLGNNKQALNLLEKCFQEHEDDGMLALNTDSIFDPLRSDPRFQRLLRQMNFPS